MLQNHCSPLFADRQYVVDCDSLAADGPWLVFEIVHYLNISLQETVAISYSQNRPTDVERRLQSDELALSWPN